MDVCEIFIKMKELK